VIPINDITVSEKKTGGHNTNIPKDDIKVKNLKSEKEREIFNSEI